MAQWGRATLWDAAADGDLELCKKRLASMGAKINGQDSQGKTALHEASRWGHLEVVQFLISKGADATITTNEGTTPLHLAAMNGHDKLVEYLVKEVKVNIDAQDKYGDTPLMAASGSGKVSTTRLLLSLGADKSLKNLNKRTAQDLAQNADVSSIFDETGYVSPTKY